MLGPQGAGKGTQGALIAAKYGVTSIATGEIFRWAIKGKTALGLKVLEYVDAGRLVPDELTIEVITDRLTADDCMDGFLLDGFPRNVGQARALDALLDDHGTALDGAIVLEVPEEVSLRRILGRRACSNCGRNYHVDAPPEKNWTCDECQGEVVERTDDHEEETVKQRLRLYHEQTEPLKNYYEDKGLLKAIDGEGSPDEVFSRIVAEL